MSKRPTRPRVALTIPAADDDAYWEISEQEIELLVRWRRLPRDVQHAVSVLVLARTSLATLPVLVDIHAIADLYHLSLNTVRRKCSEGSFSPLPARKYPYLWRREDIIRDITGPSKRLPRRPHGFAAAGARR